MSDDVLYAKQSELAILSQIIDEYKMTKNAQNISIPTPAFSNDTIMSAESMLLTQKLLTIQNTLQRLEEKGLISIISIFGTLDGIRIRIEDLPSLKERHTELFESIPASGDLPRIVYSLKKRSGKINGLTFSFNKKSSNHILFSKLMKSPKYRMPRSEAWKALKRREPLSDTVAIQDFSKEVSELRAGLRGISVDHLKYGKHYISLKADITLTD